MDIGFDTWVRVALGSASVFLAGCFTTLAFPPPEPHKSPEEVEQSMLSTRPVIEPRTSDSTPRFPRGGANSDRDLNGSDDERSEFEKEIVTYRLVYPERVNPSAIRATGWSSLAAGLVAVVMGSWSVASGTERIDDGHFFDDPSRRRAAIDDGTQLRRIGIASIIIGTAALGAGTGLVLWRFPRELDDDGGQTREIYIVPNGVQYSF